MSETPAVKYEIRQQKSSDRGQSGDQAKDIVICEDVRLGDDTLAQGCASLQGSQEWIENETGVSCAALLESRDHLGISRIQVLDNIERMLLLPIGLERAEQGSTDEPTQ